MKLIVADKWISEVLEGITLEDGWIPCLDVRNFSVDEENSFCIPQIQVAVWFKTLVLTSVTIDCDARCVFWSTKNTQHEVTTDFAFSVNSDSMNTAAAVQNANKLTEHSLLKTSDKHHTDEVGDLFTLAEECLCDFIRNKDKVTFYERMLQVLHCFVLPSITLGPADAMSLEAALDMQRALITRQDESLNASMQKVEELKKQLGNFRAQMVEHINLVHGGKKEKKDPKRTKLPWRFVQQLWLDLSQDTTKIACELTAAQSEHDIITKQINDVLPSKEDSIEQRVRRSFKEKGLKNTDMVHLTELFKRNAGLLKPRLQRAQKIKEEVIEKYDATASAMNFLQKHLLKMKGSKSHTKFKVLRQKERPLKEEICEYLDNSDELRQRKDRIMHLLNIKVQLISVREAILSSLRGLSKEDEIIYGVEYSMDGHGSTDVFIEDVTFCNRWQTLQEQMMGLLDTSDSPVSQKHFTFLAAILFQCDIICAKMNLQERELAFEEKSIESQVIMPCGENTTLVCVTNMNNSIKNHVMEMTEELKPLVTTDKNNPDKIRHCYERMLFRKIGESVETVFAQVFSDQTSQIKLYLDQMTTEILEMNQSSVLPLLVAKNDRLKENNAEMFHSKQEVLRRNPSTPEAGKLSMKKSIHRKVFVNSEDELCKIAHSDRRMKIESSLLDMIFTEKDAVAGKGLSKYTSVFETSDTNFRRLAGLSSSYDFRGSLPTQVHAPVLGELEDSVNDARPQKCLVKPAQSEANVFIEEDDNNSTSSSDSEEQEGDTSTKSMNSPWKLSKKVSIGYTDSRIVNGEKGKNTPGAICDGGLKDGEETVVSSSSKQICEQTMVLKKEYRKELQPVICLLEQLCSTGTPTDKLCKGFQASQMLGSIGGRLLGMNKIECDTLNDLMVVVLCNLKVDLAVEIFLNVEMMKAFLPAPYEINEYGFMVTTWEGVWMFMLPKLKDSQKQSEIDADTSTA